MTDKTNGTAMADEMRKAEAKKQAEAEKAVAEATTKDETAKADAKEKAEAKEPKPTKEAREHNLQHGSDGSVSPAANPVWVQGRDAAHASISEDDAPYDKADPAHKEWLAGYKFAKGK